MYRSKLTSHDSVSSHLLRDLPNTQQDQGARNDDKETLETPVVFFDTAGCEYFERSEGDGDEGSKCNENEVTVVKNWIEQLVCALPKCCRMSIDVQFRWFAVFCPPR